MSSTATSVRVREVAGRALRAAGERPAVVLLASTVAFVLVRTLLWRSYFPDLKTYRIEGFALRHGWNLYGHLPGVHGYATYPPFAALVFAIETPVPLVLLEVLNAALTIAALGYVCVASARLAGRADRSVAFGMCFAALALWCEPVGTTFRYGQINLYLLALVLADFTRPEKSRWRGVGIGLAAAIKVTGGIFVVYLILTRRLRFAATAVGTFAIAFGISLLVDAHATVSYWTDYLFDVDRVGRVENAVNQTVRGWLVRATQSRVESAWESALIGVVAVAGLLVAAAAYRRLGEVWGVVSCALVGLLVSPISWSHHWVWCVPAMILLWTQARWLFCLGLVIFWSDLVWAIPHVNGEELHLSTPQILVSGWYVLFALLFLGLAYRRVRGAPAAAQP